MPSVSEWPTVALAMLVLAIVGFFALRVVGLSWAEALALSVLAPGLVLVDVPLGEATSGVRLFANLAGCVLPVAVALAIVFTRRLAPVVTLVLLGAGAAFATLFSWVVPARGVLIDYRACALGTGLLAAALLHASPRRAGALAFAAAAIGTTIGADILRLGDLVSIPSAASITLGGAGLLDGILLTAVVSAFVAATSAAGVRALSSASRPALPDARSTRAG